MNSLSLGFYYLCGMAWALAETCISASTGNWLPIVIYLIGFIVIFSIMGCLDLSENAINKTGLVLAGVLGVVLMAYSFMSWGSSGAIVGLPKVLLAATFLIGSFTSILGGSSKEEASGH